MHVAMRVIRMHCIAQTPDYLYLHETNVYGMFKGNGVTHGSGIRPASHVVASPPS
jgi:hypothetical protein